MKRETPAAIFLLALATVASTGCGKSNPVDEVSSSESNIDIIDSGYTPGTDWNAWRGPTGNGIAPEQSLVTQWDDSTNIRWRVDIPGRGHSSPIVVGQQVFLATALDDLQQQWALAFDRANGNEQWRTKLHEGNFPSPRSIHKKATNANSTIACDGERLYAAMLNSDAIIVTALDLNGEQVWQNEAGKFVSKFGYAPSPILYKSIVIVPADNQGGGYITAFDGKTGSIVWRIGRGSASSYSSATIANVGGRDQLLIGGDEMLSSYDPMTGERNWQTNGLATSTCGTVVTTSDRILASGGYPQSETMCLDANGKKLWSESVKLYEPSPIVVGPNLVGVKDDGIAYCWSIESGEVEWKKRLGGNFSASPVLVNDLVYVPNLNGDTFVFRAGAKYELVAKNRLGSDCYASPAVSNGELFLRVGIGSGQSRKEQLVCIGEPNSNSASNP